MTSDEELSTATALVEADVSAVLGKVVDGGFEPKAVGTLHSGGSYVVEWVYSGTNKPEFLGLGAKPKADVKICGVTIVEGAGADAKFRRYIDWASVYADFDL
jgi:hypothetical protein